MTPQTGQRLRLEAREGWRVEEGGKMGVEL